MHKLRRNLKFSPDLSITFHMKYISKEVGVALKFLVNQSEHVRHENTFLFFLKSHIFQHHIAAPGWPQFESLCVHMSYGCDRAVSELCWMEKKKTDAWKYNNDSLLQAKSCNSAQTHWTRADYLGLTAIWCSHTHKSAIYAFKLRMGWNFIVQSDRAWLEKKGMTGTDSFTFHTQTFVKLRSLQECTEVVRRVTQPWFTLSKGLEQVEQVS